MSQLMTRGRWKQVTGRIHKIWGKLTHNPYEEFIGEQAIMEGKIEEFYARRSGAPRRMPWLVRTHATYAGRQRDLVA